MIHTKKEITLDESIAHFEAIDACMKLKGEPHSVNGQFASFLRRLRYYEMAIKAGELVWVNQPDTRYIDISGTAPREVDYDAIL